MKTAVEWLVNEIESKNGKYFTSYFIEFIEQAKEMEKQQIIDAYRFPNTLVDMSSEQYYNETFKNK
jgi:hypothetical protein